jgi:hypothetical protein
MERIRTKFVYHAKTNRLHVDDFFRFLFIVPKVYVVDSDKPRPWKMPEVLNMN